MIDSSDGKMDVATSSSDSDEELMFPGLVAIYRNNLFQRNKARPWLLPRVVHGA